MIRPKRTIQKPKRFLKFLPTKSSKSIDAVQAISQPVEIEGRRTSISNAAINPPVINLSTDGEVHTTNSIGKKPRISRVVDASNNVLRPKRTIQKPRRFLEYLPPESLKPSDAVETMSHPVEHGGQQTSKSIITTTTVRLVEMGSDEHTRAIHKDAASLVSSLMSTEGEQPDLIDVSCRTQRPKRTIQKPKRLANFVPLESSKPINVIEAISQPVESVINEFRAPNPIEHSVEEKSNLGRRTSTSIITTTTTDRPVEMGSDEHTRAIHKDAASLISSLMSTEGEQPDLIDVPCRTLRPKRTIQKPKRLANFVTLESSKPINVIESISQPVESVINVACEGEVHATIGQSVEAKSRRCRRTSKAIITTTDQPVETVVAEHTHAIDENAASLVSSLFSTECVQPNVIDVVEAISQPVQTSTSTYPSVTIASCTDVNASNSIRTSETNTTTNRVVSVDTGSTDHTHAIENDLLRVGGDQSTNDSNIHTTTANHEVELISRLYVPAPSLLCDASDEENIQLLPTGDPTVSDSNKRKRSRKPEKLTWGREISKKKRQHGEAYGGYERTAGSKIKLNVPRSERKMGPKCDSKYCFEATNRHCNEILDADRLDIHKQFWQDMNWDQKKIYVCGLVDVGSTNENNKYFLKIGSERKQVCRSLFLSTLSLKKWMVQNWVTSSVNGIIPAKNILNSRRAAVRPTSAFQMVNNEKREFLLNFFNDLPKMPSHYCRQRTGKQYLEPNFRNLAELYKYYCLVCADNQRQPLSTCYFSNMFSVLKLGLYMPKKDRCDTCMGYEKGNVTLEEVTLHVEQKELARKEKRKDKLKARAGLAHVFVMDAQAVQLSPQNKASALYYKQKLKNHDFSMYDLDKKDCTCYWWHEGEGDMCASMFTTCVHKHLTRKCKDELPIIIWSDGCVYQNRNQILSNALLDYSIKENKIVEQKFLVKGHTQMEVDNIHSLIERRAKGIDIDVPFDYKKITEEARKTNPIEAVMLSHQDFLQYDNSELYRYNSIRPGSRPNEATVTDIRVLIYNPDGTIGYKINFTDKLRTLPRHPREPKINYSEIRRAYQEAPKISVRRFNDLQDLKIVLDKKFHSFYDNLPHVPM